MDGVLVLQHVACEGLGTFEGLLNEERFPYHKVRLFEGERALEVEDISGLVILGGPMNVDQEDEFPFLDDEISLIRETASKRVPMLGVCLGAQLMAKALGARVCKGEAKEIGWHKVRLTNAGLMDPVFKGFPKSFTVFQWHGDTFDIPKGAVNLAESTIFPNQAFRYGDSVHAVQFHLEVTRQMIRNWVREYPEDLDEMNIDEDTVLRGIQTNLRILQTRSRTFFRRFLSNIRVRPSTGTGATP